VITTFWWGNVRVKRPLGRPRRRWEDHIKMNLQEVGCGDMDWIDVTKDRVRSHGRPKDPGNETITSRHDSEELIPIQSASEIIAV